MRTVELHCIIHADKQQRQNIADILVAQLSEVGYQSFMDTASGLKAYIPESYFDVAAINELPINAMFPNTMEWQYQVIGDKNWNSEWEKNFQPVVVAGQCLIRASFHEPSGQYPYEVVIDPKMSFGTGHHPTTHLMIEWLLELDLKGLNVLDIGSGTAILSIVASQKGALKVWAVDNNEWAYQNALENVRINRGDNITVIQGTINSLKEKGFDLILANINLNILLQDMPDYTRALNPGGQLILSGIYQQDIEKVREAARGQRLHYTGQKNMEEWVALVYEKESEENSDKH